MKRQGILAVIASAFAIKAIGSALAVLMFMAIGRASTLAAFGDFAFGFAAAQFFAVLFGVGAETVALRATSAALASGDALAARHHAALAIRMTGLGMAAALLFALLAIGLGLAAELALSIAALAALLALSETLSSILRGYGGVASALLPREILWRFALLVVAGAIWGAGIRLGAVAWLWLASALLAGVLMRQWLHFAERPRRADLLCHGGLRQMAPFIGQHWQIWVIAVLNGFGAQLPIMLVRGLLSAEATALLFAAMKITAVIALPLVASGPVVAPQISRAWARGELGMVQRIGAQTAAFTSAGAFAGLAVVVLAGPMLLGWFGPEYVAAQSAVIVLAAGQVFAALVGPTGFAMLMMGHEREALRFLLSTTLVALGLTLGLTLGFGIIGAAIGISSLLLLNKGACYLFLVRRHGVHLSLIGWWPRSAPSGGTA